MDPIKRKALVETLKSLGRGIWFGLLGLVVVALTALVTSGQVSDVNVTIAGLTVNLAIVIVAVVGYIVKLLDTYIHNNQNIDAQGLAPNFLQKDHSTATPVPAVAPYVPPVAPGTVVTPTEPLTPQTQPEQPVAPAQPTQIPVVDASAQQTAPVDPSTLNS